MSAVRKVPLPSYGKHMPVADFVERCLQGDFIDDDGYAHWASETEMYDNRSVNPSAVADYDGKLNVNFRRRATHVVWFNR